MYMYMYMYMYREVIHLCVHVCEGLRGVSTSMYVVLHVHDAYV